MADDTNRTGSISCRVLPVRALESGQGRRVLLGRERARAEVKRSQRNGYGNAKREAGSARSSRRDAATTAMRIRGLDWR